MVRPPCESWLGVPFVAFGKTGRTTDFGEGAESVLDVLHLR